MVATITIYVQICGAYKLRGCHKSSIFVIQGSLAHQDFTDFVERPLSSGYTSDMIEDIITYSFKQCLIKKSTFDVLKLPHNLNQNPLLGATQNEMKGIISELQDYLSGCRW